MTIKVGTNFIKIDAAGVHIVGSAINLNTGGSPGSGSGFSGLSAARPLGATSPEYDADLEAIEGNEAPDAPVMGMNTASASEVKNQDKADNSQKQSKTILKSNLLKSLETLEKLANDQSTSYAKVN
jgi:type VI secretion system secreted protein VgrG